ncbi:MAG: hypothetical protein ABI333_11310 [bacterium]
MGIGDFFKKLFGGGSPASAAKSEIKSKMKSEAKEAKEEKEPKEKKSYAQKEWDKMLAFMAKCDAEGMDWAGLDPNDPVGYFVKVNAITAAQNEGKTEEQAILENGFQSEKHYEQVTYYLQYKYSRFGKDESGEDEVQMTDEWLNAMSQAAMLDIQNMQAAAAAADPTLLEPVNGVSVEQWAAAAAQMATMAADTTPAQMAEMLGKHGLDRATYDAAQEGWMAKMQGDTTGVISQKYADAFGKAQGVDKTQEPCTIDYYVEIMVAQEAWAQQGMDVNAQLKATFGITAIDYSNHSQYWSMKMATDMATMRKYDELREKFLQKYSGSGMDDDLSL